MFWQCLNTTRIFFRFGNAKFIYLNEYKSYISHCYKIMASECKKWLDMREWPLQNTGFAMWSTCLSVLIPLHITVNIPLILSLRSHWNYESNKRSYTSINFCEMLQITLMYENLCLANTLIKSQCDAYIYIYIYAYIMFLTIMISLLQGTSIMQLNDTYKWKIFLKSYNIWTMIQTVSFHRVPAYCITTSVLNAILMQYLRLHDVLCSHDNNMLVLLQLSVSKS